METVMPPKAALDGLWMFDGQHERLDDELAKTVPVSGSHARELGLLSPRGPKTGTDGHAAPPLHGTYTRFCYHRVVTNPLTRVLDIFDEAGDFGHFVWNGNVKWGAANDEIGAWELRYEPVVFKAPDTSPYLLKGSTLELNPSLTLTPFSENDSGRFPRCGADKDVPCPLPFVPPDRAPRDHPPYQYIYYEKVKGQLVWALPGGGSGSDLKLWFTKPKVQLSEKPANVDESWGNISSRASP